MPSDLPSEVIISYKLVREKGHARVAQFLHIAACAVAGRDEPVRYEIDAQPHALTVRPSNDEDFVRTWHLNAMMHAIEKNWETVYSDIPCVL